MEEKVDIGAYNMRCPNGCRYLLCKLEFGKN